MQNRGNGTSRARRAICPAAALFLAATLAVPRLAAQHKPAKKPELTPGARLYKQNCAVCHGNDGKGNGPPPKSSPFTEPPPDLTTLAKRHEGQFPSAYVETVLRNGASVQDHGPAEMPVWGMIFQATTNSDESQVNRRIANLIDYLKSIQAK
ncbi:MAG TPA: cytochrome c [Verrucomicrobiae bacterium]|nr:cytochrome c [Verrucomicrobiae bacterium]